MGSILDYIFNQKRVILGLKLYQYNLSYWGASQNNPNVGVNWIASYRPQNIEDTELALREIMQSITLAGLYRSVFYTSTPNIGFEHQLVNA